MNTRLPQNPNETRYNQSTYRGLPVIDRRGPLVEKYLDKTYQTIESALSQYPRVFATRFDLMFPSHMQNWPSTVISRFLDYLKADVESYLKAHGMSIDKCKLRIVWAKERNSSMNSHYHVLMLFNRDVFFKSGRVDSDNPNTVNRIESAWAKALNIPFGLARGLVNFPRNRDYSLNRNSPQFYQQLAVLFFRASYLAKEDTKDYNDGSRHFSCSQAGRVEQSFDMGLLAKRSLDRITHDRDEGVMTVGGIK
jgi:hypothetical protein